MIRIAFVVHSLRPGGIERSVTRIVNGLPSDRYSPVIICLDRSGDAAQWLGRPVEIIELKKRPGNDLGIFRRLWTALRKGGFDIVQSHNWGTLVETSVARKFAKVPVHIHAERGTVLGRVEAGGLRHHARAKVMAAMLKRVNGVMSNAHSVAARVEQRSGYKRERIKIIPNGVSAPDKQALELGRKQVRRELGIQSDQVVFGSVGRLAHVKGFDIAVRAFVELSDSGPSCHLLLVGDGSERETIEKLLPDERRQRVHFVGHQSDTWPYLAAMDVYFNSSRSEGMSQSVVEAMACGLPIIATDVGDSRTLVVGADDECGVVVEPESVDAIRNAMVNLSEDTSIREQLGVAAKRNHNRSYSEDVFIETLDAYYKEGLNAVGTHDRVQSIDLQEVDA